jgi:CRP-like cAMP-binding protein
MGWSHSQLINESGPWTMLPKILKQMPLFEGLTEAELNRLTPLFSFSECAENEEIFKQGDIANYLYLVVKGRVAIRFKPDDGEMLTVAQIEAGGVFGWSAAFGSGYYTSGAYCLSDAGLLCVSGEALKRFHIKFPDTGKLILERLAKVIAERLQRAHTHSQVVAMLEYGLTNGVKPLGA